MIRYAKYMYLFLGLLLSCSCEEVMARRMNVQSCSVGYLCDAQFLDRLLPVS
jgi:hypothetical protein